MRRGDPKPAKVGRVMQAMLRMDEIDLGRLQQASEGG